MRKEIAIVGSLMLVAAAVPFALAHNDVGAPTISGSSTNGGTTNVYGTYNGASGVLVHNVPEFGTVGWVEIIMCDMELQHSGDLTEMSGTITEERIDDTAAKAMNTFTTPDGTFDDGGRGGVCHTYDRYANSNWNTPGCPTNTVEGRDIVLDTPPLVVTGCDWKITTAEGFVWCSTNAIRGNQLTEIVNTCPGRLSPGSSRPGTFIACGTDGWTDAATLGVAGTVSAAGVPPNDFGCDNSTAAQGVAIMAGTNAAVGSFDAWTPVRGWVGVAE